MTKPLTAYLLFSCYFSWEYKLIGAFISQGGAKRHAEKLGIVEGSYAIETYKLEG